MAKREISVTFQELGGQYTVVPSRGTKHVWVLDCLQIKVPAILFDALEKGDETALLDALVMSVELSQMIRSCETTLDCRHYKSDIEKQNCEEKLAELQREQTDQVRFLSNRWFDLRHEARQRGEKIPPIR